MNYLHLINKQINDSKIFLLSLIVVLLSVNQTLGGVWLRFCTWNTRLMTVNGFLLSLKSFTVSKSGRISVCFYGINSILLTV
jgi:hypothetical protein